MSTLFPVKGNQPTHPARNQPRTRPLTRQRPSQTHGGIGITTELAAGHYFKRLSIIEGQYGDFDHHMARLEAAIDAEMAAAA